MSEEEIEETRSWIENANPSLTQIEARAAAAPSQSPLLNGRVKSRQAAVIFIFITVVLDMLAIGLIAPVLPKLVLSFLNDDMKRAANWEWAFS